MCPMHLQYTLTYLTMSAPHYSLLPRYSIAEEFYKRNFVDVFLISEVNASSDTSREQRLAVLPPDPYWCRCTQDPFRGFRTRTAAQKKKRKHQPHLRSKAHNKPSPPFARHSISVGFEQERALEKAKYEGLEPEFQTMFQSVSRLSHTHSRTEKKRKHQPHLRSKAHNKPSPPFARHSISVGFEQERALEKAKYEGLEPEFQTMFQSVSRLSHTHSRTEEETKAPAAPALQSAQQAVNEALQHERIRTSYTLTYTKVCSSYQAEQKAKYEGLEPEFQTMFQSVSRLSHTHSRTEEKRKHQPHLRSKAHNKPSPPFARHSISVGFEQERALG
eukprot:gene1536-921_t